MKRHPGCGDTWQRLGSTTSDLSWRPRSMTYPVLGRLKVVPARDVWPPEALDFAARLRNNFDVPPADT